MKQFKKEEHIGGNVIVQESEDGKSFMIGTRASPPAARYVANLNREQRATLAAMLLRPLLQELDYIHRELHTQDNAITHNPIFMLQEQVREYGIDPDYLQDGGCIWLDDEGEEVRDDELIKKLNQAEYMALEETPETAGYRKLFYRDHWEHRMPFFTRAAADEYLRINGHNIRGKTRIYVESGYRNKEWELLRKLLMSDVFKREEIPEEEKSESE